MLASQVLVGVKWFWPSTVFFDLTFGAPPELLEAGCESGLSVLRELRLVDENEDAPEDEFAVFQYEELLRGFVENPTQVVVRLFLRADKPPQRDSGEGGSPLRLPSGYLPRSFVVTDACVANSSSVWCEKHFYM